MGTILPKRGEVHVGKRLEFLYKTVTIMQKFHSRENSYPERRTPTPLFCAVKPTIDLIPMKNNDPPRMDVMK